MRLGVAGLLGEASPEQVRAVRDLGFSVASWHVPAAAWLQDPERLSEVADTLHAEDLELCQLLPPAYPSLVHPDPSQRDAGLQVLRDTLAAAARLRVDNVYVRPGSLNPAGAWTPHPENHAAETRDRLVESLRSLAPEAEAAGVALTLEAHTLSPLYSPAVVREVFDRVGSTALRFNADPVNLIGSVDQAFHNTALIHELFDLLGDAIHIAHAKDVTVGSELVLHIEECIPGLGYLDHEAFLRRFEACCPRGVVLIEHLPAERVPEARRALLEFARKAGTHLEAA